MRKLFKNTFVQNIFALLIFFYINFVRYSSFCKKINLDNNYNYISKEAAIYIFWHGRMMLMPYISVQKKETNILISPHRDGKLIAKVMKLFRFKIIEGSTNKESFRALRLIFSKLAKGENIVITPDGPRGPARKINSNLLYIAYKTKKPIIPISFVVKNFLTLNSWDTLCLAYPFNYGKLLTGKIFHIESNEKEYLERQRIEIEKELNRLEQF